MLAPLSAESLWDSWYSRDPQRPREDTGFRGIQERLAYHFLPVLVIKHIQWLMFRRFHPSEISIDQVRTAIDLNILPRIFFVAIIHPRRNKPCPRKHAKTGLTLVKISREQTVEFALDPFRVDVVGEEM